MINVKYKLLKNGRMPQKKTRGAACADCYAALKQDMVLATFESSVCPLGFCIEVPEGYYAEIRPRSGLSSKGILVQIGTVDSDYRGEVGAIIGNFSGEPFRIKNGDRIAQIMIKKIEETNEEVVEELSKTIRGAGGFGSTGI